MRFLVKGADRRTGIDQTMELDADDETAAAKDAGRQMFIESIKRVKVKPCAPPPPPSSVIPYASAAPLQVKRPLNALQWAFIAGGGAALVLVILLGVGALIFRSGSSGNPATTPPTHLTVTYAQIVQNLGNDLRLKPDEKTMTGETVRMGQDAGERVTLLVKQREEKVTYAHLALVLSARQFRLFAEDASLRSSATPDDLAELASASGRVQAFIDNIAPPAPGQQQLATVRGIAHNWIGETVKRESPMFAPGGAVFVVEYIPITDETVMLKIAIEP